MMGVVALRQRVIDRVILHHRALVAQWWGT